VRVRLPIANRAAAIGDINTRVCLDAMHNKLHPAGKRDPSGAKPLMSHMPKPPVILSYFVLLTGLFSILKPYLSDSSGQEPVRVLGGATSEYSDRLLETKTGNGRL
jgi:hypothetical protein